MTSPIQILNTLHRVLGALFLVPLCVLVVKNGAILKQMVSLSRTQLYYSSKLKMHIYLWLSCVLVTILSFLAFLGSFSVFPNDVNCSMFIKITISLYGLNVQCAYLFLLLRADIIKVDHSDFYKTVRRITWYSIAIFSPAVSIPLCWWVYEGYLMEGVCIPVLKLAYFPVFLTVGHSNIVIALMYLFLAPIMAYKNQISKTSPEKYKQVMRLAKRNTILITAALGFTVLTSLVIIPFEFIGKQNLNENAHLLLFTYTLSAAVDPFVTFFAVQMTMCANSRFIYVFTAYGMKKKFDDPAPLKHNGETTSRGEKKADEEEEEKKQSEEQNDIVKT